MLRRILVPLDGSELSSRILGPVARLAARTRSEVRAIRVLDEGAARLASRDGENAFSIAAGELTRLLAPLGAKGIATTFDTYTGDPAERILADAATYKPSLIAMATHGRSGVSRWLRGSVAERTLRASSWPLLIASPAAIDAGLPIRKILVPLDGSEMSAGILPAVHELAKLEEAEVLLLLVIDEDSHFGSPPTRNEGLELLEGFAQRLSGVRTRTLVEKGAPATKILEVARSTDADLVAMTTHGRSGISRWVFGSTAEHVLQECDVPLLVVRTSGTARPARTALELHPSMPQ